MLSLSFAIWGAASLAMPSNPKRLSATMLMRVIVGIAQGFLIPSIHTVLSLVSPVPLSLQLGYAVVVRSLLKIIILQTTMIICIKLALLQVSCVSFHAPNIPSKSLNANPTSLIVVHCCASAPKQLTWASRLALLGASQAYLYILSHP